MNEKLHCVTMTLTFFNLWWACSVWSKLIWSIWSKWKFVPAHCCIFKWHFRSSMNIVIFKENTEKNWKFNCLLNFNHRLLAVPSMEEKQLNTEVPFKLPVKSGLWFTTEIAGEKMSLFIHMAFQSCTSNGGWIDLLFIIIAIIPCNSQQTTIK